MTTTTAFNDLLHEYFTDTEIKTHRKQAAISSRLEMWRVEHKMTQKQFADLMGVTQAMVSKWESGDYNFTIKTLAQLSEKLDIEMDQLFTGISGPKAAVSYVLVNHQPSQFAAHLPTFSGPVFSDLSKTSIQFPGGTVA